MVWNDTVANLTLMALGSSAPEILLSVIELIGNNMSRRAAAGRAELLAKRLMSFSMSKMDVIFEGKN